MVRHSDIRIFLGKTFPLITVGDNIQFIELVLTAAETITEENESTIFIYNNRSFSLIKAGQGKIIINENGLFQIHDLNKALSEFRCLKDTYGNVPYTDIFFGEGTYPETMAFTNSSKALLNAKIYASVMKRVYNWFRFGSDNPIYINHHVGSQLAACIMIDTITYQEGKPVIGLNIIQNDVVIQSVKVNLPFLIKTDELINKYTPKVICLTEVETLMNQIKINSHSLVTLSMIEKMANALASRQYTKGEIRVTLQTKNRAIRLIGTNNPDLGGVSFIESNSELSTANVLNEDRILIGTLINGLALLRREYGDDYLAISGEHISPIDITPDVFSSMFFVGTSCYQDIVDNITTRVARGQKTFSSFDEKGVRVRCVSWTGNKPYYSIECVSGDKMFIFDDYFSLTSLIEAAGEKTRVFEEATPVGFIQRLKQSWFGMFA